MPSTYGNGQNSAQPKEPGTTSRQPGDGSGPLEAAILTDQATGHGTGEWLSDLMACYDFWNWSVADDCPEASAEIRSEDEQAVIDALMQYYNH